MVETMRVLRFNANIKVYVEDNSSTPPEKIAEEIDTELCLGLDIPQALYVMEYTIKDVAVRFAGEDAPIPNDEES